MKNFEVGSQVVKLLEENEAFCEVFDPNEIYPLVAIISGATDEKQVDVHFPFIIYSRTNYEPQNNKDYTGEKVWMSFMVAAKSYKQSLTIADKLCDAIYKKETDIIDDIKISNLYEDWMDETFIQNVNVEITLKD